MPEPSLEGKRLGKLTRHPSLGEAEAAPHDSATDALPGEPVELPVPESDVWPVFNGGAAESHRGLYPERAAEYGPAISAKLERAIRTTPEAYRHALEAMAAWQRAAASEPSGRRDRLARARRRGAARDRDAEEEFRVPFSAYARPFNFLGWPAIAIGETQLAARDMRTLLETALAWPPR